MSSDNLFENLNFNPENMKTLKDKSSEIKDHVTRTRKMIASIEVEGNAGIENYSVKVFLNGRHEAIRVVIDPQLMSQPVQVLCDLIASAVTDAAHKVENKIQTQMLSLFGNIKAPN